MSIVTDFAKSCHTQSAAMISTEPVVIGGTTVQCVLAEADRGSDFSEGGYEPTIALSAVCRADALPSVVLKKSATARGQTFRVDSVALGGTFATLRLTAVQKS